VKYSTSEVVFWRPCCRMAITLCVYDGVSNSLRDNDNNLW